MCVCVCEFAVLAYLNVTFMLCFFVLNVFFISTPWLQLLLFHFIMIVSIIANCVISILFKTTVLKSVNDNFVFH